MAQWNRSAIAATLLLTAGLWVGCSQDHEHAHGDLAPAPPAADRAAVAWPQLTELDILVHDADHHVLRMEIEELRELTPRMQTLALTVADADPPPNARNMQQVRVLQGDLRDVASLLEDLEEVDDDLLISAVGGIIALTEELMDSAGVPHVHHHPLGEEGDYSGEHAHDHHHHDGHDHDHSHDHEH